MSRKPRMRPSHPHRKRARRQPIRRNYRRLFEQFSVGLFRTTPAGVILEANETLAELLGYPDRASLLKVNVSRIYQNRSDRQGFLSSLKQTGIFEKRGLTFRRQDGSLLVADTYARALRDRKGEVTAYEGCIIDTHGGDKALGALREAEAKYRTLVERLPNAIIYLEPVDPAADSFYISPQIEDLLGCPRTEFHRKSDLYAHMDPGDRERVIRGFTAHMESGEPFDDEYRLTARDGRPLWVRDQAALLRDEAGLPRFSHGILMDISESKNVATSLARQMDQLNALHMVSQEMVTAQDIERVYRAAHEAAVKFVPVDAFIICLIDENLQEAEDVYLIDKERRPPKLRSPLSKRALLRRVVESGEPVLLQDYPRGALGEAIGAAAAVEDGNFTRSILAVPLMINGRAIGMISAQHYAPDMYNPEHVQAMVILANQVAIVIEHTRLMQSYRLRVAALNAAANTIVITNRQGRVEWANPATTRLTGYTLEEVLGRNIGRMLKSGQQDEAFYENLWKTILSGRVWQGQLTNRAKGGSLYTEEMTITPLLDAQGEISHFIAIKQDISDRQQAELALRESEEKYRTVVEQAEDGIAIIQQGIIMFANRRLAEMRGEEIRDMLGQGIQGCIDGIDRDRVMEFYRLQRATEDAPANYEAILLQKDGTRLQVEINAASISYLGEPAELVIVHNISERKQAEEILRRRLKEMAALNEVSAAGVKATEVDELIAAVTLTIRDSLYPANCGVILYNEEAGTWTPHKAYEGIGEGSAGQPHPLSEGIVGRSLRSGAAIRVNDTSSDPEYQSAVPGIRSEICVPLTVNGILFGCLNAESFSAGTFAEHDERLMTTLAGSLSIAIEKIQLFKLEQQRRAEAAAITEVGRDISASLELDTVLKRIVTYARELLRSETSAVYLADPEGPRLYAVAAIGIESEEILNDPIQVGQGILGSIASQQFGEIVNDVTTDPRALIVKNTVIETDEHIMAVPVLIKGKLIGLIAVWRTGRGFAYKPTELDFLNSLAQQVGMAIENARLFEVTQKRLREMEGMVQVGAALSHTLELEPLLEEVLQAAIHAIPAAERGSILLADKEGSLHVSAVWGYTDPRIRSLVFPPGSGYSNTAFHERRAVIIQDVHANAEGTYQGDILESLDRGSAIAAPLIVKDRPIGVIAVDTPRQEDAFDDGDLDLLQAMASSAALAIENARLFNNTRQRLSEIQAVHTVSTALRSAQTLGQALPIILDQLMEIMDAGAAALDMVDTLTGEIVTVLAHGAWASVTGLRTPPSLGISGHVVDSGRPYVTLDVIADGYSARPDLFNGLNVVGCVPVIAQHQPIGVLWVGRNTPITAEEVSLLSAIGEMVGNALHRMRLNEQTQHRADQLASLRTIDQAISASLDLRLTLNILLEQVVGHLQVHAAEILLLDRATRKLTPSASRGFRTADLERFHQQLGGGLGPRVARERRVLHIPNLAEYADQVRGYLLLMDEEFVSYIGVPLIAKEQLVGVLECYQRTPLKVDADWQGFLEALAGQAAIAIDKARLLEDLQSSNLELTRAYDTTLEGWARALELRDKETEGHSRRVTDLTVELARELGFTSSELIHLRRGVLLHDIGKMGVSDQILKKTGPLNEAELAEMRKHPQYAYDLIYPISYLRPALDIPFYHHEKWDGSGYPQGLRGGKIPLPARIFAVVDVWDALLHDRPYRKAWTREQTVAYIREQSGIHFDPAVVEAFLNLMEGGGKV